MQCIPIRDLKDTNAISKLCHESREPIMVTKNGYSDMVVMSAEVYDRVKFLSVYERLMQAEEDIAEGRVADARESLRRTREKYGL